MKVRCSYVSFEDRPVVITKAAVLPSDMNPGPSELTAEFLLWLYLGQLVRVRRFREAVRRLSLLRCYSLY